MAVLNCLIKIANKAEAMFGNTLREGTKPHSALYFQDDLLLLPENRL